MLLDIAKLLLQKKIVNYQNIKDVLEIEKATTIKSFKDSLINKGLVEKDFLEDEIRKNFGANIEDIKDIKVDEEILSFIRKETATVNLVLPLRIEDEKLVVAMANPSDLFLLDQLGFESGYGIAPVIASKETIRNAVIKNYKVDFNDQHIEIKTLDFSNSAESIINELQEFENGNANKTAEFETSQTQPELEIENSNEDKESEEIPLQLETDTKDTHEIENSSITENSLSENPDPFKSSLSVSASEKDEPKQDSPNPFQSSEVQSVAEEPDSGHIEQYEKVEETKTEPKNPFSSAVSSVNKTDLASESTEELTPTVLKETVAEKTIENEIKVEELKKEVEPLDEEHNENQTSPFVSAFSAVDAVDKEDSDEAVDVTEELSTSVHNVKTEENDGSNDVEVEELKADEEVSEENSNELNPFASGVAKVDENTPQDNPFDQPSDEEVFVKTEAEAKQKPFDDNIDITEDEEQSETVLSNISILIVDKSTTMRRVMTQTLEKKGYNITNSDNAIDAISKINSNKPDLIVLDTKLPHIDGYQLCKTIKKNADTKDIPIVMLSGKDGLFDKMKGKMSGANEYIAKPFKPNRLISVIEKLVAP